MVSSSIKSGYYALNISSSKTYSDIYKIFYNLLTKNFSPTEERFWYSSFPDCDLNDSSSYPVGIINSADIDIENFTQTKEKFNAVVEIEIFTTKSETRDDYASDVLHIIRSSKHQLRKYGVQDLRLLNDDKDTMMRDQIKVHTKLFRFGFNFKKNKASLSW
jgi:hypothetical protein